MTNTVSNNNFTADIIKKQLALRSNQIGISTVNGGSQFVDQLTGKTLISQPVGSSLLANPQKPNDPKIKSAALNIARGYFAGTNTPSEMIEAIASVAAYVSATQQVSVSSLFQNNIISDKLIGAYNEFKQKGSQIGLINVNTSPAWVNNLSIRGSIAAAILYQS